MEKLKAKHDHSLTDILKVLIFGIVLLIPLFMWVPSMLYFAHNDNANAPTTEVTVQENKVVDFNQKQQDVDVTNWASYYATISKIENTLVYTSNLNTNSSFVSDGVMGTILNHKYVVRANIMFLDELPNTSIYLGSGGYEGINIPISQFTLNEYSFISGSFIRTNTDGTDEFRIYLRTQNWQNGSQVYIKDVQFFDLTQMFGDGNEPTIEQFNTYFPNAYYPYTESEEVVIENYSSYTIQAVDITTQVEYNWETLWKTPMLNWTNYALMKQGLNSFTSVFGITDKAYITNLITYELMMIAIYIVIDIVISIFKWLTHLIGTK